MTAVVAKSTAISPHISCQRYRVFAPEVSPNGSPKGLVDPMEQYLEAIGKTKPRDYVFKVTHLQMCFEVWCRAVR